MYIYTAFWNSFEYSPFFYPFLLLFACMNEEIRHESSNRGINLPDQSVKQGMHKIYPEKHLKQSVEKRDRGGRRADKGRY